MQHRPGGGLRYSQRLITDKLDRIPAKDEHPVVRINNVEFTVLDTEERRIAKLRADILPEEPKPEEPDEE